MPTPCQDPLSIYIQGLILVQLPCPLPDECTMLDKTVNPTPADRAGHGCWPSVQSPLFNKGTSFLSHIGVSGEEEEGDTGQWALRNQREEDL